MRDAAELFPKFAFFLCNLLRQLDVDDYVKVALPPAGLRAGRARGREVAGLGLFQPGFVPTPDP